MSWCALTNRKYHLATLLFRLDLYNNVERLLILLDRSLCRTRLSWVKPGPKSHAYLLFGFTLARANARMLINAEAKRRSARNSVRASRPQCTSAVAVHG